MKVWSLLGVFGLSGVLVAVGAQDRGWKPAAGHVQVAIWPGAVPDARAGVGPEVDVFTGKSDFVAGRPYEYVGPVSRPTMTVYSPKGRNTGAAVVVFPGGGYQILAMDLEGTEVCDWLTAKGVTCVVLKYRVPGEGKLPKSGPYPDSKEALEDAQRTMGLVRLHAAEWGVDPHKVGVLGFSAGGHLVAAISTQYGARRYKRVDAADDLSCRPDFGVAVYPGHLWIDDSKFELNPAVPVTRETPPQFLVQAEDDDVDPVEESLVYYRALRKAGVAVEMHLYAHGGHAFGLRRTDKAITEWPGLVDRWLRTIGMVGEGQDHHG